MPTEELFGNYMFLLEVSGETVGFFKSVDGLSAAADPVEEKISPTGRHGAGMDAPEEGKWMKWEPTRGSASGRDGLNLVAGKPSRRTLVLRGFKSAEAGAAARLLRAGPAGKGISGVIKLRNEAGGTVAQWNFENAWPSKTSGPLPKADGNDFREDTVIMSTDTFRRG